jgi:hypothetical protein
MNRLDMSSEEIDQSGAEAFGVGEILQGVTHNMITFFKEPQPFDPHLLTIKGEIGAGKTIFALRLLDEVRKDHLYSFYDMHKGDLPYPIMTSMINSESDLNYLNIWRPILR